MSGLLSSWIKLVVVICLGRLHRSLTPILFEWLPEITHREGMAEVEQAVVLHPGTDGSRLIVNSIHKSPGNICEEIMVGGTDTGPAAHCIIY